MKKFLNNSWDLLKTTFKSFGEYRITKLSGSLAYSTVFSMGPLLVVIIALCGIFLEKEVVEGKVYNVLQEFLGHDTASQLEQIIHNVSIGNKSSIALVIGIVTLFIGSTAIFSQIQSSVNFIWDLKPKPRKGLLKFIRDRFLSFSVIVSLGFLLLVSLVVTGIIEAFLNRLRTAYPDTAVIILYLLNLIFTLFISTLIFAFIFKVLPDAKVRWKDTFTGAFITAILFMIGKFGISLYVSNSKIGSTYGAAGSLVILLVWVYYSSLILFFGASFTKNYILRRGVPIPPSNYAVTTQTGKRKRQSTAYK